MWFVPWFLSPSLTTNCVEDFLGFPHTVEYPTFGTEMLPYDISHYMLPFIVAAVFSPPRLKTFCRVLCCKICCKRKSSVPKQVDAPSPHRPMIVRLPVITTNSLSKLSIAVNQSGFSPSPSHFVSESFVPSWSQSVVNNDKLVGKMENDPFFHSRGKKLVYVYSVLAASAYAFGFAVHFISSKRWSETPFLIGFYILLFGSTRALNGAISE